MIHIRVLCIGIYFYCLCIWYMAMLGYIKPMNCSIGSGSTTEGGCVCSSAPASGEGVCVCVCVCVCVSVCVCVCARVPLRLVQTGPA